jgi:hypothetical protein
LAAILKMADILKILTTRNSPQYHKNSTLSDIKISYVGRLWCPELIPDIEKFLPVAMFTMAATIPHKFNIVRFQRNFICSHICLNEENLSFIKNHIF